MAYKLVFVFFELEDAFFLICFIMLVLLGFHVIVVPKSVPLVFISVREIDAL